MTVLSLDEAATRDAASRDPGGFLAALRSGLVVIDEIQHAPELLPAIKDRGRQGPQAGPVPADRLRERVTSKKVKDALTGRIETLKLWPLGSERDTGQARSNLVDALFAGSPPQLGGGAVGRDAFTSIVAAGGYPEALLRTGSRRERWFESYVDSTLDSDLRDISDAIKLEEMPRLLRLLAVAGRKSVVLSERRRATRYITSLDTVKAYVGLLEQLFFVRRLQAWRPGFGARESSTPKVYLVDSGLLANLLGADQTWIAMDDQVTGKILENFVAMEVAQAPWVGQKQGAPLSLSTRS